MRPTRCGIPEKDHDRIPDILIERPAVFYHNAGHFIEVMIEPVGQFYRCHFFDGRREIHDIRKTDGQFFFIGFNPGVFFTFK